MLATFLYSSGVIWQRPVGEAMTLEWWELIKDYSETKIRKAFSEYLRKGVVFPVPGLVIPLIEKAVG